MAFARRQVFFEFLLGGFLTLCFSSVLFGEEKLLVFGRVQDDPVKAIRDRQGFVDYIAKGLAPHGITGGRILVVDKLSKLAQAIREGKVDLFHDSVVPTVVLSKWAGTIPILRQWKHGEEEYYGVIAVHNEARIHGLSNLKGKVIAFDEPHSTSAHVLPRMLFARENLTLVPVVSPGKVAPGVVGFVHTSDGNGVHLLVNGRVDAAATSDREFNQLRPEIRSNLRVIAKTKTVPRLLIAVRKELDPRVSISLKGILLGMNTNPEGRATMKKQQNTSKIDEIAPDDLAQLKEVETFIFSALNKEVDFW